MNGYICSPELEINFPEPDDEVDDAAKGISFERSFLL